MIGATSDIAASPLSLAEMLSQLDYEIELAELSAQHYPPSHPIQAALANAQITRAQLADLVPWYSTGADLIFDSGSSQWQSFAEAIDAIYTAGAFPSDEPMGETVWQRIKRLPWAPITVGTGAALAGVVYMRRGRRGARR